MEKYSDNLKFYKVKIETWNNNEKVLDNTVQLEAKHFEKEEKKEDEGLLSSLNPFSVKTASAGGSFVDFLRGFNNCLASQGIAAWDILQPVLFGTRSCISLLLWVIFPYRWSSWILLDKR